MPQEPEASAAPAEAQPSMALTLARSSPGVSLRVAPAALRQVALASQQTGLAWLRVRVVGSGVQAPLAPELPPSGLA